MSTFPIRALTPLGNPWLLRIAALQFRCCTLRKLGVSNARQDDQSDKERARKEFLEQHSKRSRPGTRVIETLSGEEQWHVEGIDDQTPHKSSMSFLSSDTTESLRIVSGYNEFGFRLHTGTFLYGPVILFPKASLSWQVVEADEITCESLQLLPLVYPKLEVVLVGVGESSNLDTVRRRLTPMFRQAGISVEVLSTQHAIEVFNYLSQEKRWVACALHPPIQLGPVRPSDEFETSSHYRNADDVDVGELFRFLPNFGIPAAGREIRQGLRSVGNFWKQLKNEKVDHEAIGSGSKNMPDKPVRSSVEDKCDKK